MKFAGTVVLYNPEKEILENIKSYLPFIDILYVMDNSTKEFEFLNDIKSIKKVKYISLGGNKGIAKALKIATETAIKDGYDFLLSMDQDSKFPTEDFKYVKDYVENNDVTKLGIICVNYLGNIVKNKTSSKAELWEVNDVITSGSFLNLKNYSKIDGYNEDLFIDLVDHDLFFQFREKDYKILLFVNIFLNHKLGEKKEVKFLFYKRKVITHSPVRYYYMYRNFHYLKKNRSGKYLEFLLNPIYVRLFKFKITARRILTEKQHLKILKMIIRGIHDGKKGILGPYEERRNKK